MKANESYFNRLQGHWEFDPSFKVLSWNGLFRSEAKLFGKLMLAAFVIAQEFLGKYEMYTAVELDSDPDLVKHRSFVKKFGLKILKSEKVFRLDANGFDLSLEGAEFYWPFIFLAHPFPKMTGRVEEGATRAFYNMPLVGLSTKCETVMEAPKAFIKMSLPWFEAVFNFTPESMKILNSRPTLDQVD